MNDWKVFQADVLDVLRQYQGFFNFFERVGSLSDNSRPDCFARIDRKNKKQVWIIDAKNKEEIEQEDLERMRKYVEMAKNNPIDVGLDIEELKDYSFRGIFVLRAGNAEVEEFESIGFKSFHQFLQRELIYSNTDKLVRDISKMAERKQLSQSQARLLFRSLKPFEKRINKATEALESIEENFASVKMEKPPFESFNSEIAVDAVLKHEKRDKTFIFDIPYSREALKQIEGKSEHIKEQLDEAGSKVFFAAINTLKPYESRYTIQPDQIEEEFKQEVGILSLEEVAEIFKPKVQTSTSYKKNTVLVTDDHSLNYHAKIASKDDINFKVEVSMPPHAAKEVKNAFKNSRTEIGRFKSNKLELEFQVTEDLGISHETEESVQSFRQRINRLLHSEINPVLSQKVKQSVQR
ncbi:MAG: hypothetical protein ABEJ83_00995 [Candidatus Nanohaloarchaea archaeon]